MSDPSATSFQGVGEFWQCIYSGSQRFGLSFLFTLASCPRVLFFGSLWGLLCVRLTG